MDVVHGSTDVMYTAGMVMGYPGSGMGVGMEGRGGYGMGRGTGRGFGLFCLYWPCTGLYCTVLAMYWPVLAVLRPDGQY